MQQAEIINVHNGNSSSKINLDSFPNVCPTCHHTIRAETRFGIVIGEHTSPARKAEITFICANDNCRSLFIAYYGLVTPEGQSEYFELGKVAPKKVRDIEFSDIISGISTQFVKIYNQAHKAEEAGLNEICGVGYRKALEFLIKDYLISLNPEDADEIKNEFLSTSISERIANENLKDIAKRATWLGNDETHYERKWTTKNVNDLKAVITLAITWIEMEETTKKIRVDMPDK